MRRCSLLPVLSTLCSLCYVPHFCPRAGADCTRSYAGSSAHDTVHDTALPGPARVGAVDSNGAGVEIKDKLGRTPLAATAQAAASTEIGRSSHGGSSDGGGVSAEVLCDVLRLLAKYGADVDTEDRRGATVSRSHPPATSLARSKAATE